MFFTSIFFRNLESWLGIMVIMDSSGKFVCFSDFAFFDGRFAFCRMILLYVGGGLGGGY